MMAFNSVRRRVALHALLLSCGLLAGTPAMAQDLSVPADPVAAIEGDWNGIWQDWSVTVTNGRVVLTKGDPKTYSWLPIGTVLGVLNNNGKSDGRLFRFSGSTCLDYPRDKSPSEYQTIQCGDFGAVLTVYADAYELNVSGISLRRSRTAIPNEQSSRKDTASNVRPPTGKALVAGLAAEAPAAQSKYIEVQGPDGTIRLSPDVIARNEAAAAEHQRNLKEYEDAVARAKAEHDRELARHAKNVADAAVKRLEHEQKLADNAALVAAHTAKMDEYKKKLAGGASTNDDPKRCITSPAIKPGLRGNTEAHVTNGCDQKVDIVICLKRTSGDWHCGAQFGLLSQRSMSVMSTNATGEIYVDAVTYGSKNKLGRPAGIIN